MMQHIRYILIGLFFFGVPLPTQTNEPYPITLLTPMKFVDHTVQGKLTAPLNITELTEKPVSTGDRDENTVEMCDYTVTPKKCETASNCKEFDHLVKRNLETTSHYSCAMRGFYVNVCDRLKILKAAKPSQHSNFQNLPSKIKDMEIYPKEMIDFFGRNYGTGRDHWCVKEKTFLECTQNQQMKIRFNKQRIEINMLSEDQIPPDIIYMPTMKADINNDGWEDLIVFWFYNIFGGQHGLLCLERPIDQKKVSVIPCFSER